MLNLTGDVRIDIIVLLKDGFYRKVRRYSLYAIVGTCLIISGIIFTVYTWVNVYPELGIKKKREKVLDLFLEFLGSGFGGIGIILILIGVLLIMSWAGFDFEQF